MKTTRSTKRFSSGLILVMLIQSRSVYRQTDKTLKELTEVDQKVKLVKKRKAHQILMGFIYG